MNRGYTKSYRKELDSDIWMMSPLYHRVWFYIRSKAKWEIHRFPTKGVFGIWLNPGQLITSIDLIADGVKWSEWGKEKKPNKKTIRDILSWLESNGMIQVESNSTGTFINIVNWDVYNTKDDKKVTELNQYLVTENKRLLETIKELEPLEKKKKKEKTFSPDSAEVRLSDLLYSKILLRNPEHKQPDIQKWAKEVDYMIRLDKRDPQKIANVIGWVQGDSFWQNNILSTESLRRHFDALVLKMGKGRNNQPLDRIEEKAAKLRRGNQ